MRNEKNLKNILKKNSRMTLGVENRKYDHVCDQCLNKKLDELSISLGRDCLLFKTIQFLSFFSRNYLFPNQINSIVICDL